MFEDEDYSNESSLNIAFCEDDKKRELGGFTMKIMMVMTIKAMRMTTIVMMMIKRETGSSGLVLLRLHQAFFL